MITSYFIAAVNGHFALFSLAGVEPFLYRSCRCSDTATYYVVVATWYIVKMVLIGGWRPFSFVTKILLLVRLQNLQIYSAHLPISAPSIYIPRRNIHSARHYYKYLLVHGLLMNVNSIVIKGRFSIAEGGIVDLCPFCLNFFQKHCTVNSGVTFIVWGMLLVWHRRLPNRLLNCEYSFVSETNWRYITKNWREHIIFYQWFFPKIKYQTDYSC